MSGTPSNAAVIAARARSSHSPPSAASSIARAARWIISSPRTSVGSGIPWSGGRVVDSADRDAFALERLVQRVGERVLVGVGRIDAVGLEELDGLDVHRPVVGVDAGGDPLRALRDHAASAPSA